MKSGNRTSSNPIDTADASEIRRSPPVILMKPYKKTGKILHLNRCNGRISKPSTSQPSSPRHPKTIEENSKRPNARREENTPQTTSILDARNFARKIFGTQKTSVVFSQVGFPLPKNILPSQISGIVFFPRFQISWGKHDKTKTRNHLVLVGCIENSH